MHIDQRGKERTHATRRSERLRRMADAMETDEGLDRVRESPEGEAARLVHDLEHSIEHLVRSNNELEEYLRDNELDAAAQKELRVAIGENIVVIARRRAMLEDLYQQAGMVPAKASSLQQATAERPTDANPGSANPELPPDGDSGMYL